jgi:hypothetical protein
MTLTNKLLLAVSLITICACGGGGDSAGNPNQVTRHIPVNINNSSAASARFQLPNIDVTVAAGGTASKTVDLVFPNRGTQGKLTGIVSNPATGQELARSNTVTINTDETIHNLDFNWGGGVASITKE